MLSEQSSPKSATLLRFSEVPGTPLMIVQRSSAAKQHPRTSYDSNTHRSLYWRKFDNAFMRPMFGGRGLFRSFPAPQLKGVNIIYLNYTEKLRDNTSLCSELISNMPTSCKVFLFSARSLNRNGFCNVSYKVNLSRR
ncbi:hypothetical protein F3Y22_tig00111403pilonHSYRG00109 [Hibiscus syriacus]|uniref:Uncharacterized protein n=1 Tax=Hibiscus syriacus TaxID=106335 RepID=A0A6A2XQ41_HIBSY|nr:hypothetical protein F3Y22_tig00111403pilonHSYRG00109 [Hibiscus syriacus]